MNKKKLKFSEYYHQIIIKQLSKMYDVKEDEIFLGSRKKNIIFAKRDVWINNTRDWRYN